MFDIIERAGASEVHCCHDPDSGLHAIIAIHSTALGPALGGCRFLSYPSDEAALEDALRLARGMSYKAALARVPFGGGKAVVMKPAGRFDRKRLFEAFGQFVANLGGRYITAVDSGTLLTDMDVIATRTGHVSGRLGDGLNPSPETAYGVFVSINAAIKHLFHQHSLEDVRVAIQGVGNVGWELARLLHEAGARLVVSDVNEYNLRRAVKELGATAVSPEEIHAVECEVFAPCALGGVVNDNSIDQLDCQIICGAANNQLATSALGEQLMQRRVLYVPDYVANAGGLIRVGLGRVGASDDTVRLRTLSIGQTVQRILAMSDRSQRSPSAIADQMAMEHLREAAGTPRRQPGQPEGHHALH